MLDDVVVVAACRKTEQTPFEYFPFLQLFFIHL